MALLEVTDLQTTYRMRTSNVVAVDGVSFHIDAGECLGIVGESGCGKTTIGMSIMRLLANNGHVTGGQMVFDGVDLASLSERDMRKVRGDTIALIPQTREATTLGEAAPGRRVNVEVDILAKHLERLVSR